MFGATKLAELNRTAEMCENILIKHQDNPKRAVADILHMIRSSGRTSSEELQELQAVIDERLKK